MKYKRLLENWNTYLQENHNSFKIYCDMDGVLVDFGNSAIKRMNAKIKDPNLDKKTLKAAQKAKMVLNRDYFVYNDIEEIKKGGSSAARNFMFRVIANDEEWWATLPWASGGKQLWNHIKQYNPTMLTSPVKNDEGSSKGKIIWVKNNLGLSEDRIILSHDKYNYAITNNEPNILIDDSDKNIIPFRQHGGIGILHRTDHPEETIKTLENYIRTRNNHDPESS